MKQFSVNAVRGGAFTVKAENAAVNAESQTVIFCGSGGAIVAIFPLVQIIGFIEAKAGS